METPQKDHPKILLSKSSLPTILWLPTSFSSGSLCIIQHICTASTGYAAVDFYADDRSRLKHALLQRAKHGGSPGEYASGFNIKLTNLATCIARYIEGYIIGHSPNALPIFIGATYSYVYWSSENDIYVTDHDGELQFTTVGSGRVWKVDCALREGCDRGKQVVKITATSKISETRLMVEIPDHGEISASTWDCFGERAYPRLPSWLSDETGEDSKRPSSSPRRR